MSSTPVIWNIIAERKILLPQYACVYLVVTRQVVGKRRDSTKPDL